MDGRIVAALLLLGLPALLIAVTIVQYAANPLAILVLFTVMVGGFVYLLSYQESF